FPLSPKDPKSVVDFIVKNAPIPVKGEAPILRHKIEARSTILRFRRSCISSVMGAFVSARR
ncbi:MAG TPA: hypothetical protein VGY66_25450, partial [Gemmataceae bacterium]|nr:hypothetical protein [Gemmataceae bacterium]